MEKITIHRALSELKLIDSRIEKAVTSLEPVGLVQEGKLVNGLYDKAEYEKDVKAKYQSINDLIERKIKIKSAIVNINGKTKVKIAGNVMSISDAITYKMIIEMKKNVIVSLSSKNKAAKTTAEKNNKKVDESALRLAEAALQKDNVKINDGDAIAITEPFINKNKFNLVDPLHIDKLLDKLTDEVDEFEAEVDAVLSEINAITFITI